MLWMNIKRVIRAGFVHFYRNGFVSLSSVLVMTVTLFVIGGVVFLTATLTFSLEELKKKVDVNVYFQTDVSEEEILSLAKQLRALPEVTEVVYISREQAIENFRARHAGDELTLQALNELPDNPLGAVLTIRAHEPSQYPAIVTFISDSYAVGKVSECPAGGERVLDKNSKSIIDEINYCDNKAAIDKLSAIIDSAETLGAALALLLVIISLIIAFNTVRLAIYISREEISVMRLVGASNKYIRGPFVVSGILYGVSAAFITLAAFYPVTYYLGSATENFFGGLNVFRYYLEHFGEFFLIIGGAGIVLGAVSSFWAVRRYLNV